jgi:hypothetical protein
VVRCEVTGLWFLGAMLCAGIVFVIIGVLACAVDADRQPAAE